jgi:hypothetical protein
MANLKRMNVGTDCCLDIFIDQIFGNSERFSEYELFSVTSNEPYKMNVAVYDGYSLLWELK